MIFDNIRNINKYKVIIPHYNEIIELLEKDLKNVELGEYKVNNNLRYIISKYNGEREKPFEVHKNEIDLQIILSGKEKMEVGNPTKELQKYDIKSDCALSLGNTSASIFVRKNDFVLFFREEYHKPGILIDESITIKKVIFKIKCEK